MDTSHRSGRSPLLLPFQHLHGSGTSFMSSFDLNFFHFLFIPDPHWGQFRVNAPLSHLDGISGPIEDILQLVSFCGVLSSMQLLAGAV